MAVQLSPHQHTPAAKALATLAYALLAGAWAYVDQRQIDFSETAYEVLNGTVGTIAVLLAAVLTGWFVGRTWVLLALLGPLAFLGYLQVTDYVSPWHDGNQPLVSLPSAALFVWLAVLLLIGIGIARGLRRRRAA